MLLPGTQLTSRESGEREWKQRDERCSFQSQRRENWQKYSSRCEKRGGGSLSLCVGVSTGSDFD